MGRMKQLRLQAIESMTTPEMIDLLTARLAEIPSQTLHARDAVAAIDELAASLGGVKPGGDVAKP